MAWHKSPLVLFIISWQQKQSRKRKEEEKKEVIRFISEC